MAGIYRSKEKLPLLCNSDTDVMEVTSNHFLIGFKATPWNGIPYLTLTIHQSKNLRLGRSWALEENNATIIILQNEHSYKMTTMAYCYTHRSFTCQQINFLQ